jgi:outer membrane protein TolC
MKYISSLVIVLLFSGMVYAQESVIKEVSPEFLDKLIALAKANYPKMKSYDSRIEVSSYTVKKAKLSYFEILSASYIYNPPNTAAGINPNFLNGYQFGFFFSVGSLLAKPAGVKQAKAEVKVAQNERDAFELGLVADVQQRYYQYVQRTIMMRLTSQGLLDVDAMLKEIRYKFEKGEETLDNYNKALVMYNNQLQGKIGAETDVLMAKSSLEELIGQKLESVK